MHDLSDRHHLLAAGDRGSYAVPRIPARHFTLRAGRSGTFFLLGGLRHARSELALQAFLWREGVQPAWSTGACCEAVELAVRFRRSARGLRGISRRERCFRGGLGVPSIRSTLQGERDLEALMTCRHPTHAGRALARAALLCAAFVQTAAHAGEADAKRLLKAMSDYLAAQKAIAFDFDSSLEIVSTQQQKITLAASGSVILNRPDKLHVTRRGGFANMEMSFDGKTVTLLGKNSNLYAQVDAAGSVDQLVDVLRDKYHRPVPGADLLMADPYKELMPEVTDIKDLGSGVIRGVECDHLAFRTHEVDWQIWIAQGSTPYPCRYVITSTKVAGAPEYSLDIRDWKTGAQVAADPFKLAIPTGAQKLTPEKVQELSDIPAIFKAATNPEKGKQ
jgi:hypothetical protein